MVTHISEPRCIAPDHPLPNSRESTRVNSERPLRRAEANCRGASQSTGASAEVADLTRTVEPGWLDESSASPLRGGGSSGGRCVVPRSGPSQQRLPPGPAIDPYGWPSTQRYPPSPNSPARTHPRNAVGAPRGTPAIPQYSCRARLSRRHRCCSAPGVQSAEENAKGGDARLRRWRCRFCKPGLCGRSLGSPYRRPACRFRHTAPPSRWAAGCGVAHARDATDGSVGAWRLRLLAGQRTCGSECHF